MGFQRFDLELSARLREVLENHTEKCLVCIPPVFGNLDSFVHDERYFWRRQMVLRRQLLCTLLPKCAYGDAFISRCYLRYADRSVGGKIFELWKELFSDRDILVVEGRLTRLGIGDDLLSGARSVRRIWCPPAEAFSCYVKIINGVRSVARKTDLIVLSLGATASVLAYDLSKEGYWLVDTGHLDVEYNWMRMGATRKVLVPGHYTGEVQHPTEDETPATEVLYENNVILDLYP